MFWSTDFLKRSYVSSSLLCSFSITYISSAVLFCCETGICIAGSVGGAHIYKLNGEDPHPGLAILFNLYQVNDKIRIEPVGKRRGKGRPKKVM